MRGADTAATVVARLRSCPAIGVGLVHRIAAEEQRQFLKAGPVAVGGKYGRTDMPRTAKSAR
jgi:hypothetical protein